MSTYSRPYSRSRSNHVGRREKGTGALGIVSEPSTIKKDKGNGINTHVV